MKGKEKKAFVSWPVIFFLSIICLIISGTLIYLLRADNRANVPPYEEIHTPSDKLGSIINKIDKLVYESLYENNVKVANIMFSEVRPRHKNGSEWEFTELTVKLSDRASLNSLEKLIQHKFASLYPDVKIKKEKISDDKFIFNVYALDLYTHRLKLVCNEALEKAATHLPKVAIIIDDIGYDRKLAESFMDIKLPISLSLLPCAPYTREIANEANKRKCEILLHLPMEPKGYPEVNPGPGALFIDMDKETIQKIVKEDIADVPGLKGVNNHMGSLFTEKYDKMKYVMDEIKRYHLFYVDSRTTNKTVAFKVARAEGVPAVKKDVFLDDDLSEKAIKYQMERLLGIARYSGQAVGIGHPHKETLKVLREYAKRLEKDFNVVPVSDLVK